MKSTIGCLVVMVALIIATSTTFAQTDLVGQKWVRTVEINKQFPNPDLIQPGDTVWVEINGNHKYFIANPDSLNSQWAITVAALRVISTDQKAEIKVTISKKGPANVVEEGSDLRWLLYLMLALLILFSFGLWLYNKKPTEWRPMVINPPEGVITHRLQEEAQRQGGVLIPGSQEKVRLSGLWGTQHHGVPIPIPHRYSHEKAWRARFAMPDGFVRIGYMLQSCGNDVSRGAWYIPFPGAKVEEGWGDEAESTSQSSVPAAHVPAEPAAQPEEEVVDGLVKFEMRRANDGQPAMIRLSGVDEKGDNTFESKPGVIVIRYTPKS